MRLMKKVRPAQGCFIRCVTRPVLKLIMDGQEAVIKRLLYVVYVVYIYIYIDYYIIISKFI